MWRPGLAGELVRALRCYLRIGWWGLVAPRIGRARPLLVVQAVIRARADVLLSIRSDLRGWELPGGNPEVGESAERALLREVREET